MYSNSQTSTYYNSLENDKIWKNFYQDGHSKMVVLGDHFFYVKDPTIRDKRTIIRRDNINSSEEFQEFLTKNPDSGNYRVLAYQLFPKNSIWPFADLHPVLHTLKQQYLLKAASSVTASDIKENDIIFLGSFHTLAILKETFRNSNFNYKVYPNEIILKDTTQKNRTMYPDDIDPRMYHTDYGFFRKIPGPGKNVIYLFTSFHETGMIGIIKYFVQKETLNEIENRCQEKFGYIPEYFEILFKSSGYNHTVYTTEIEQIYEINMQNMVF